jgi:hypothetical protein
MPSVVHSPMKRLGLSPCFLIVSQPCISICICIYIYLYFYLCLYLFVSVSVFICICIYLFVSVPTSVICICIFTYVYICTCTCTCFLFPHSAPGLVEEALTMNSILGSGRRTREGTQEVRLTGCRADLCGLSLPRLPWGFLSEQWEMPPAA